MHTAASASIAAVVNSQHTTTVSADCACARHPARPLLKVNRACSSVASTVETAVTAAFATTKSIGPDSSSSTPEDARATVPPLRVNRAKSRSAPGAPAPAFGRRLWRVRSRLMVSMPGRLPVPADRALTAR
ncbi:hypothetical protein ACFWVC_04320 [Streptomyces sp. NPDC058691]|uniref:hypothetical protein n=1 Tax=Streptomyces sp. NPDC058691 TaxID=3346601 RepID=UPI003668DDBD